MTIQQEAKAVSRLTFEQRMYASLKRKGLAPQFERAGIYGLLLDGKIVYIGKSGNMLQRMAEHYVLLAVPEGHKYELLAEAARLGHTIRFTVLYAATSSAATPELEEEIGAKEGELIRQRRPPLNYQIPKAENWRKFTINSAARTITLPALLEQLERDSS